MDTSFEAPSLVSDASLTSSPSMSVASPTMLSPPRRPESRGRSDSVQRKRRSLNIMLPLAFGDGPPPLKSPDSDGSGVSGGAIVDTIDSRSSKTRKRWSSIDPVSSTTSSIFLSEQDRQLQEKLQQLARTENARLIEEWSAKSQPDSSSPDCSTPVEGGGLRASPELVTPTSSASLRRHHSLSHHHRRRSPGGGGFTSLSGLTAFSTSSQIPFSPTNPPFNLANGAADNSQGHIRSRSMQSSTSNSPRPPKRTKGSSRERSISRLVISDDDLQKLDPDQLGLPEGPMGPSRPGNIGGTVLSWKMTSDIVRASASSLASPQQIAQLWQFVWAMFSRPENFSEAFRKNDGITILPPAEVVESIRRGAPRIPEMAMGLLKSSGYVLSKMACTTLAFSVLFVQMLLISVMLVVYMVGDVVVAPVKMFTTFANTKDEKVKLRPRKSRRKRRN
uniref:ARAD1C20614p n=1 Tax=Blastobotrys adeninivorans TaxID=409370 RepID=A0A060T1H5_BLAAD